MKKCQNCQHWLPRENREMAKHGFAMCAHQPRYVYYPPQHGCGKFAQAEQKTIEMRAAFLEKQEKKHEHRN